MRRRGRSPAEGRQKICDLRVMPLARTSLRKQPILKTIFWSGARDLDPGLTSPISREPVQPRGFWAISTRFFALRRAYPPGLTPLGARTTTETATCSGCARSNLTGTDGADRHRPQWLSRAVTIRKQWSG